MAQKTKKTKGDLDRIPCKFGNINVGTETCAIGVTVERDQIDYVALEPVVVGARLEVRLTFDPNGQEDADGQSTLIDTATALESVVDCPSLKITPRALGFRLSFNLGSVDVTQLLALAQAHGTISITRLGALEPKKRGRPARDGKAG